MKIVFNEARAEKIFNLLAKKWQERSGIFTGIILPQDRWPLPPDQQQAANWLFFSSFFQRGGSLSEDSFKWTYHLFCRYPEIFDTKYLASQNQPAIIADAIIRTTSSLLQRSDHDGAGAITMNFKEQVEFWQQNALKLENYWGGNILNVYGDCRDFERVFSQIDYDQDAERGLLGIRRKIFSLLTIYLQEKKFLPFFNVPLPIDFHALRILWATEIISLQDLPPLQIASHPEWCGLTGVYSRRIRDEIAAWAKDFLPRIGVSHLDLNPAIWCWSRELCTAVFQNKSQERHSGRAVRIINSQVLAADPNLWPQNYADPCSHCALAKYCSGTIPQGPYYRAGVLIRQSRVAYPVKEIFLPGVDWLAHQSPPKHQKNKRR